MGGGEGGGELDCVGTKGSELLASQRGGGGGGVGGEILLTFCKVQEIEAMGEGGAAVPGRLVSLTDDSVG